MKQAGLWSGLAIGLIVGGIAGGLIAYQNTKDKWFALGVDTGIVAGRAEVMEAFCAMGNEHRSNIKADYVLEVKARRLQAVQGDGGVQIFCE